MNALRHAVVLALAIGLVSGEAAQAAPPPASTPAVQWTPSLSADALRAAPVVRVPAGVHAAQLANLRNEQFIEVPSGRRIQVRTYRSIVAAFTVAHARTDLKRPAKFVVLPVPRSGGTPLKPGTTSREIFARPDTDVLVLRSGKRVSVAQLRAMAPYVEKRYGVNLAGAHVGPPVAVKRVTSIQDIRALPRNAPDSTVLETSAGHRITLGQLKAELRRRKAEK